MLGFRIDETMTGFHEFKNSNEKKFMEFVITWGPDNILKWLNPFGSGFLKQELEGHITIDGLCKEWPCYGELTLAYYKGEICYKIYFIYNGKEYCYIGKKKHIKLWNLLISHTTCYGNLKQIQPFDNISKSIVYFNFSTMWEFLSSFRFV